MTVEGKIEKANTQKNNPKESYRYPHFIIRNSLQNSQPLHKCTNNKKVKEKKITAQKTAKSRPPAALDATSWDKPLHDLGHCVFISYIIVDQRLLGRLAPREVSVIRMLFIIENA